MWSSDFKMLESEINKSPMPTAKMIYEKQMYRFCPDI